MTAGVAPDLLDAGALPLVSSLVSFTGHRCDVDPLRIATSCRQDFRIARDRRYFVIVTAKSGEKELTSQLWV